MIYFLWTLHKCLCTAYAAAPWTKPKQFIPSFYFLNKNNNFKQRISWFSYRWRPKRISIYNANCWFRESSNCWTHIALLHKRSIFVWVCVEITWKSRLSACGERFFFVSSLKINTHINRNMFLLGECESMVPSKRNFEAHNSSLSNRHTFAHFQKPHLKSKKATGWTEASY